MQCDRKLCIMRTLGIYSVVNKKPGQKKNTQARYLFSDMIFSLSACAIKYLTESPFISWMHQMMHPVSATTFSCYFILDDVKFMPTPFAFSLLNFRWKLLEDEERFECVIYSPHYCMFSLDYRLIWEKITEFKPNKNVRFSYFIGQACDTMTCWINFFLAHILVNQTYLA